jgi:hypothetical protein
MESQNRSLGRKPRHELVGRVSRRSWLSGAFLGLAGASAPSLAAWSQQSPRLADDADSIEIARVQASAKKAGLEPFAHSHTAHFIGLGDAPDAFRDRALGICESLAPDFLKHFRDKGFTLALPERRLTVITLKDDISYQAYSGQDPGTAIGGHYDLDANQLVMFDFRPQDNQPAAVADPKRVNLLALVHETVHLLCFNTGLLSRKGELPMWVSEGLATYVEMWTKKKSPIGAVNRARLFPLQQAKTSSMPWIPIADLIAADKVFDDETTAQLAYAESWLLVHSLMKEPRLPRFRAFLSGLPIEGTADERIAYAEKHLGSLKTLDHDLRREFARLSR